VANERRYPAAWLQRSVYDAARDHLSTLNVPIAIRLRGPLDKGRLREALTGLVARHEALRTRLVMSDSGLMQVVPDEVPAIELLEHTVAAEGLEEACLSEFARPCDLRGPLVRTHLFTVGERDHLLAIAADHTIMDGFSAGIIIKDLAALYAGDPLQPPALQYGDYAAWENRAITAAQREYWVKRLSEADDRIGFGASPVSPVDYVTTQVCRLPEIDHDTLAALARSWRVPVVALLGAVAVMPLRGRVTRSCVLGLFVGNRDRRELASTVGFVADLMPVPVTVHADQGLEELARDIADVMHDCQDHRVPLRAIRDLLRPQSGMPLFDVSLNYLPPLRQLTAAPSAGGLAISGSFLESLQPARLSYEWYDGAAFVDYRWRAMDGRLTGYLGVNGPDSFGAAERTGLQQPIMREVGELLGSVCV
jgi:Condensation domain